MREIDALKKQLSQVEKQLEELRNRPEPKVGFLSNLPSKPTKSSAKLPAKSLFPKIGGGTSAPTASVNQVSVVCN